MSKRDRRIPSVLAAGTGPRPPDPHAFLTFSGWTIGDSQEWLLLAAMFDRDDETVLVTSAIAPNTARAARRLLTSDEWRVDVDSFGHPDTWTLGNGASHYESGIEVEVSGITLEPLTILRGYQGYRRDEFIVRDTFLLHAEIFRDSESGDHVQFDDEGVPQQALRFVTTPTDFSIFVRRDIIIQYLRDRRKMLVRFYDVNRDATVITEERVEEAITTTDDVSRRWGGPHPTQPDRSFAILHGKRILRPARRSARALPSTLFLIGRNSDGSEIVSTCDPDVLSNYFEDRGTPHFLTPVFFTRDVLARYYANTRLYTVDSGHVRCLAHWVLRYDQTQEGRVQVWLGDLASLPASEQQVWRQYNVVSDEGITPHRMATDFGGEFADPATDPVFFMWRSYEAVKKASKRALGSPLFRELADGDRHVAKALRMPLNDDPSESDEQVLFLSKLLVDSIDESLLKRFLPQPIEPPLKGSLDALERYLNVCNSASPSAIVGPLRTVQSLRSSGSAHRRGDNYSKELRRAGLESMNPTSRLREIFTRITHALKLLEEALR